MTIDSAKGIIPGRRKNRYLFDITPTASSAPKILKKMSFSRNTDIINAVPNNSVILIPFTAAAAAAAAEREEFFLSRSCEIIMEQPVLRR